ncbi:keratinocyte-associated protein 3 isoform X1 [Rhinopithecus roxellana]|uniref:keratinocyte-associated protein 3 isoform X1 n=1 Tax=Rhinopithecus roxellana TaxID=61622 RepID=UPI0012378739|nr:keratinocyte-associated protein 3 isoform X1 [Rhinopithecus roxellana]XP_030776781.1 keratinocyte-associated protein 3 isoform X1 [Rhinopithecus roxellana]
MRRCSLCAFGNFRDLASRLLTLGPPLARPTGVRLTRQEPSFPTPPDSTLPSPVLCRRRPGAPAADARGPCADPGGPREPAAGGRAARHCPAARGQSPRRCHARVHRGQCHLRRLGAAERFRGTCGSPGIQEPSSPSTGLLDPLVPLDEGPGHTDCPFDPTRIYDTALALWIPSLLMSAGEAALSGYCCVAALTLRGVGPCRKEGLQGQLEEMTELESPKHKRQENEQLLDGSQEIQASQRSWV